MWRTRTLASQILLATLGILVVTMALGAVVDVTVSKRSLDTQYQQRALSIAWAVAQIPEIRDQLQRGDPQHAIQALAEQIRHKSGATYVVVADRDGIRYSHPNPALIGKRLEEPVVVLDGRQHLRIDPGSLGRSVNARVPVSAANRRIIGEVSVGILESTVWGDLRRELTVIGGYSALALGLGVVASLLLARRIKKVTFGLEPAEIVALLQEREAMLHGIREGVLGYDADGRINVINAEAQRLLHVGPNVVGTAVEDLVPAGRLRDLLTGTAQGTDEVALADEYLLVVNRMPVVLGGRDVGSVVTLRDRTELESLIRELRSVTGLTDALRAQEHEFANRLHIVSGLLEMGAQDEVTSYLAEISRNSLAQAEDVRARIAPPAVAALLVAKVAIAAEQGVRLVVTDDSHLDQPTVDARAILTVVGNLVDNAIEALADQPGPREVTLSVHDDGVVRIVVSDNGPGVTAADATKIFTDGYSTKTTDAGARTRRGLGLALVRRMVHRARGTVEVVPGPGARFVVTLPIPVEAAPPSPTTVALDSLR